MGMEEKTPSIQMRIARVKDRPRLIPLINTAFAIEDFLEGTRTDDGRLSEAMEKGEILMAEDADGKLLGSIYIERRGKEAYLGMLAVDPALQGRGVARTLMQEAEGRFRSEGIEAVEIIVLNMRPDLMPLYRKLGFEVTGTEDFKPSRTLKPGVEVHGVVMKKRL
jgi:ribosomal protein S18 acetylase RimI-like enzyme